MLRILVVIRNQLNFVNFWRYPVHTMVRTPLRGVLTGGIFLRYRDF